MFLVKKASKNRARFLPSLPSLHFGTFMERHCCSVSYRTGGLNKDAVTVSKIRMFPFLPFNISCAGLILQLPGSWGTGSSHPNSSTFKYLSLCSSGRSCLQPTTRCSPRKRRQRGDERSTCSIPVPSGLPRGPEPPGSAPLCFSNAQIIQLSSLLCQEDKLTPAWFSL